MKIFLSLAFVTVSLITSVNAQWSLDSMARNPIDTTTYLEVEGQLFDDGMGGVYVTWQSGIFSGPVTIKAQRLDSLGYSLWVPGGKTIVHSNSGNYYAQHFLVPDDSNNVFMIWENGVPALRVQKFNSNGDTLFAPYKTIYTGIPGYGIEQPYVMPDDSGGVIILWKEDVPGASTIKEMRIDKNGNNFWTFPSFLQYINNGAELYGVASDGSNGAYYFYDPVLPTNTIYIKRVSRSGTNIWGAPVQVTNVNANMYEYVSKTAYDSLTKGCYFFYPKTDWTGALQYIDTAGTLRWSNGGITVNGPQTAALIRHNQIMSDGSGGVYLGYAYLDNPDTSQMIYVLQHYDSSGASTWNSADTIVMTLSKNAMYSINDPEFKITKDNSGGVIFTWDEFRNNKLCIYAQRYIANGNKLWQASGFPVVTATNRLVFSGCTAGCDWLRHSTRSFGSAGAVVSWTDNRNAEAHRDIYVARIDGNLPTGINEHAIRNQIYIYPNPARDELTMDLLMGEGEIFICNMIGERVYESVIRNSQVKINLRNLPPGIYFVKVSDGKNIVAQKFVKM